ncbi:MAG: N-acetyltransferase [Verrucomicrobia bacterium]|nr:N-acetyltransferase [Verrucomicrobiota bacterium]
MSSPLPVVHNVSLRRFEDQPGDGSPSFLSYTFKGDCVVFDHTFVPDALRGRGIAAKLARAALEEARQRRWRIIPRCSYVAAFIKRHPEFADLVDQELSS